MPHLTSKLLKSLNAPLQGTVRSTGAQQLQEGGIMLEASKEGSLETGKVPSGCKKVCEEENSPLQSASTSTSQIS